MEKKKQANKGAPKQLKWRQRVLLCLVAGIMRVWSRTLRFHWAPNVQAVIDHPPAPSVVILWHNRLFPSAEFFRRNFSARKLSVLISASGDGAWLAAFLEKIGMRAVRGSRYNRGPQALRELITASEDGCDIGVTPDGSRGPMYDMKAGALTVALKTGAPILLLSFNFSRAKRLGSWDRFYLPMPFSRVEVLMDEVGAVASLGTEDPKEVAPLLKARLDAITVD